MAELTPMQRQYREIKERNPGCMLFFRLGDFYEMFDEDAIVAARELDLTLTTRDKGRPPGEQTPMCGVPFHACEGYIARLIAKGYKVALCEQLTDPAASSGLVERDVTRIYTPGTVTESSMLEENRANYLCALWLAPGEKAGAAAFCDLSTGEFCVSVYYQEAVTHLVNELGRFSPREAVLSERAAENGELTGFLRRISALWENQAARFDEDTCRRLVEERFGEKADPGETLAAGALLGYLTDTQKIDLRHLGTLDRFTPGRYMELDYATRRSLELTENLRTGKRRGSLLWVLDRTVTPMGGRRLRAWIERPLLHPGTIRRRLAAVAELLDAPVMRAELFLALRSTGDMQRIIGRCTMGTANARDLRALAGNLAALPRLRELLAGSECALLRDAAALDPLEDLQREIDSLIADDPPFSVREGGLLRPGADEEIDRLRSVRDNGTGLILALETRERERTGVKKLKVGYNKVFGYYIEVPRAAGEVTLPDEYVRRQTLVSGERYFTPELKELEETLVTARDRIEAREYELFDALRARVAAQSARVQAAADTAADLDALCSLAEVAFRNNYCCPEIDLDRTIDIREGRHPVVEAALDDTHFVPNDTFLNGAEDRAAIITGPNMAGKSTYMRQTALIVLMAQMGSFVPAKSALIGVTDRVFTRIGASDDLAGGQSTFMVEMAEMAGILRCATAASLLILDEIGRGTSTYDGMAIARAILEHCADRRRLGARTMFATHYHELAALGDTLPGVRNYSITARKQGNTLIFLRKIVPGSADDSYGIEVARLAGVPEQVVKKARQYLEELETAGPAAPAPGGEPAPADQVSLHQLAGERLVRELSALNPDTLTPLEALNELHRLRRLAEG